MDIKLILASHGDMATGLKNTANMILGNQESLLVCNFYNEDSLEDYSLRFEKIIEAISDDKEILVLVDIWGGTPFNIAYKLKEKLNKKINIISGINLPMVIKIISEKDFVQNISEFITEVILESKEEIKTTFELKKEIKKIKKEIKNSDELGITHIRLDERLIHGQVATLWIGNLGVNRVMVIDDLVVKDEIAKSSLKAAIPSGIKLSILKKDTAIKRLLDGVYKEQRVLILAKNIETIFYLIDKGLPIKSFNLGNFSSKGEDIQITKSVFLKEEAINRIIELEKKGIKITVQMVPMEEIKTFSEIYRK